MRVLHTATRRLDSPGLAGVPRVPTSKRWRRRAARAARGRWVGWRLRGGELWSLRGVGGTPAAADRKT